ncbi:hypothetical protein, partial [Escherichia coli]|uniref:hypothetical protein n=1 Tax=Escherichia coli TaxID=562 RepID=UPI0019D688F4
DEFAQERRHAGPGDQAGGGGNVEEAGHRSVSIFSAGTGVLAFWSTGRGFGARPGFLKKPWRGAFGRSMESL